MIKTLVSAIFLSQALMQDVRVFHERAQQVEYINYGNPSYTRRVNTFNIRAADNSTVVVPQDGWATPKAPIPYYWYWDNNLNQTAQQLIAILSMLDQELNEADQSPVGQELQRLKERIEEKILRRNLTNP